jgi:aspartate aminotransferase
VWVDVSRCAASNGSGHDHSAEFAHHLLEEHKVAVMPGSVFGDSSYIRLSYACPDEQIREGVRRIFAGIETFAHAVPARA